MSQENTHEKTAKKPRKKTSGCLLGLIGLLIGFTLAQIGPYPLPLNTMPIAGTITIFDEHGKAMSFQPIKVTCFSHYAPAPYRSKFRRTQTFRVNESEKFSLKAPAFAATLCFLANDKKYAAVVEITPNMPPTNLTITLVPTFTLTGRLVSEATGTPIANQKIKLDYLRWSEYREYSAFERWLKGLFQRHKPISESTSGWLHSEVTTTDSEGFFTFASVIPGIEYILSDANLFGGKYDFWEPIEMPILEPEQYKQPFDLGDVVVR